MATLTVQTIDRSGLEPTFDSAASGGDEAVVGRPFHTVVHVKNGDTSDHTVTIASQVSSPPLGTSSADETLTVPAGSEAVYGPLAPDLLDSDDKVQLSYDAVTSVTLAILEH